MVTTPAPTPPPHTLTRNRAGTAWVADCPVTGGAMMHLGHSRWRCGCGDFREIGFPHNPGLAPIQTPASRRRG